MACRLQRIREKANPVYANGGVRVIRCGVPLLNGRHIVGLLGGDDSPVAYREICVQTEAKGAHRAFKYIDGGDHIAEYAVLWVG
jgi:hypothetical protein